MTREITWQDCLDACDELMEIIKRKMKEEPEHGKLWQEKLAVAMYKKQEALIMQRQEQEYDVGRCDYRMQ